MKTIKQALLDEIYYPINEGLVDNKILSRDLEADAELTVDIYKSNSFKGALADCLLSVVEQATSISEADKSVQILSDKQITILQKRINNIYASIGEEEQDFNLAVVEFGAN